VETAFLLVNLLSKRFINLSFVRQKGILIYVLLMLIRYCGK